MGITTASKQRNSNITVNEFINNNITENYNEKNKKNPFTSKYYYCCNKKILNNIKDENNIIKIEIDKNYYNNNIINNSNDKDNTSNSSEIIYNNNEVTENISYKDSKFKNVKKIIYSNSEGNNNNIILRNNINNIDPLKFSLHGDIIEKSDIVKKFYIYNKIKFLQKEIKIFLFKKNNEKPLINLNQLNKDINELLLDNNNNNSIGELSLNDIKDLEVNDEVDEIPEKNRISNNNTISHKNSKTDSIKNRFVERNSINSFYSLSINFRNETIIDPKQIRGYFLKKKKYFKYKGNHNKETNKKEGFGKILWEDGSYLYSKFINSKIQSVAHFHDYPSSSTYKGYYKDNIPSGYGIYIQPNYQCEGIFYKNEISNNNIGIEFWKDDHYYQGEFLNNYKNGIGTYRWPDGTCYYGEWNMNKMTGYGVMKYNNDNLYEGEFLNGVMNGFGFFKWANNRIYIGNYKEDRKNGFGIFIWNFEPLNCYFGFWENGKQKGLGIKLNKNIEKYYFFREGRKPFFLNGLFQIGNYFKPDQIKYQKFMEMNVKNKIKLLKKLKFVADNIGNLDEQEYFFNNEEDYDSENTQDK